MCLIVSLYNIISSTAYYVTCNIIYYIIQYTIPYLIQYIYIYIYIYMYKYIIHIITHYIRTIYCIKYIY